MFQEIKDSLQQLYRDDARPWLAGFSGNVGPKALRPYRWPNSVRPYEPPTPFAGTSREPTRLLARKILQFGR